MADDATPQSSHRRLRPTQIVLGILLLAAIALIPPYLNVNRLQRRIVTSMSQSLGRQVHLDDVSMHVLPMPGFTIKNLVISDDPTFGDEPVIRANTVRATLRLSSLWRRQVEFGTIRFDEPSVNLVRRADGRWNLESILLHAAQTTVAPTAQQKPGPAPRFPYIEATGARVNIKMGVEKLPFSFTDATFALWLPSPQQWRVRLTAKPARTDTDVPDTGLLNVEGTLERAAHATDVPLDLTAHWSDAPLGEASRLFTGNDAGWRGKLDATTHIHGTLGEATLNSRVKFIDLRRTDFVPLARLQVTVDCTSKLSLTTAVLREPQCAMDTPAAEGSTQNGALHAVADSVDLTGLHLHAARIGMTDVPLSWLLDWARLFSSRIPAAEHPEGVAAGSIAQTSDAGHGLAMWQGELHAPSAQDERGFHVAVNDGVATLDPVNVLDRDKTSSSLVLSGAASVSGYNLHLSGTATTDELASLATMLPPLSDGINDVLPKPVEPVAAAEPEPATALHVDFNCARVWLGQQTCDASSVAPTKILKHHKK